MPNKSKNLIVYCPGYSGLPFPQWNPLLRRFKNEGFDVVSINYKNFGRGSISETADRVVNVIKPLRDQYDHVTLVGHSMGGLVARKALMKDVTVADSLATLGTPHRGTEAAISPLWWIGGKSVGQMQPASKTIRFLTVPKVPTLTIGGKYDLLVKDAELPTNLSYEGPIEDILTVRHIELPTTHLGLILSYRAFGELLAWIQYEVLQELPRYQPEGRLDVL